LIPRERLRRYSRPLLAVLATAAVGLGGMLGAQEPSQAPSGHAILAALRAGGYVLVMRHASSPMQLPAPADAAPGNVTLERQLDERGRSTARAMGEALKALHIPIGPILSSPAYRALETVRLAALGTARPVEQLATREEGMGQAGEDAPRLDWLRKQAALPPPAGSNTLIVTHAPNIMGAFAGSVDGLADGETLVFRPLRGGGSLLLARVKIEEWPRLAGLP
jgi:phosphohistidine phosphatase SixA